MHIAPPDGKWPSAKQAESFHRKDRTLRYMGMVMLLSFAVVKTMDTLFAGEIKGLPVLLLGYLVGLLIAYAVWLLAWRLVQWFAIRRSKKIGQPS